MILPPELGGGGAEGEKNIWRLFNLFLTITYFKHLLINYGFAVKVGVRT